ncbi:yippee zinc-binding/DNA-binding /Mis18, centromere assembly-domain-containing protein [Mrakia frigida]|uniref:yippee zinc-binding/DNA-binding /Mis18, centromere assembly-domain-containing protein n=1 Tax=Mrakia frigida TaxID=29902 RepID=UPI003FCC0DC9
MGQCRPTYLTGDKVWACKRCKTHLTSVESLMSKKFNGQHGQAYLFHTVVNINEGPVEDRPMTTGLHTVRDISCKKCSSVLGWKYERAYETSQKYKEGRFILEKALLVDCTDTAGRREDSGTPSTGEEEA